jgi:hypothetical protein
VPPQSATFRISGYTSALDPEAATGSSVFGRSGSDFGILTYFPFSVAGAHMGNATSFSISTALAVVQSFAITSQTFVVPSLTTLLGKTLNATIAIAASRSCDDVRVQVAAPFPQIGTLAPKINEKEISVSQLADRMDGYALCHGLVELEKVPTGSVTLKAVLGGDAVDTLLVNGGAAGW